MGFAWRCFPILGLELKFFGVDGGFPHSPGSTGSGHFLYTIVSRLGSCCKFSPLVSLQDNHMGVRSTRVRTIVCYSCSYVGTVVPIQTCMGPRPDSSQCVNIIRHSADTNPQSRTRIYCRQAMCIPMSLSPNSRFTVLSYQYRLELPVPTRATGTD